ASETFGTGALFVRPRCDITTTLAALSPNALTVGSTSRIRPSSEIFPESPKGTFRSARTNTRRPDTPSASRSSSVFTEPALPSKPRSRRSQLLSDQLHQVDEPVGVAPLVVVPADRLDLVADHLGKPRVEDARGRVGDDVGRDDGVLGVGEDALHRTVRRRLHRRVDLVHRRLAG